MDSTFFYGFADELVKMSAPDDMTDKYYKRLMTGSGAAAGAIPMSLIGALAGGKGRRGKGALAGLLAGALLGGASGRQTANETLKMLKEGEDKDLKGFHRLLEAAKLNPGTSAASGALNLGTLGALMGLIAGGKGKRLKRALFTGGSMGAIGGMGGLGIGSAARNMAIDADTKLRQAGVL